MSWFDDDETAPQPAEPSALGKALDAIDAFADKAVADFEADPIGFTASALGAPRVDIDLDDSDGRMGVKVDGLLTSLQADWDDAKGASVQGQAGMDWGAAPLLKGKVAVDADGDLQEISTAAKLTIPVDGVLVSAEEATSLIATDDGFKASMSTMAGANIDGIDLKGGTHIGYEDMGDRGFKANFGPDVSAGMGTGNLAPGMDIAEGELKSSTDFSFGEVDGQATIGLQQTDTASAKVFGQTVASVQGVQSAAFTSGPKGNELIFGESVEGTIGAGPAMATGKAGATWEVGTDGDGNDIDRVTLTDSGKATFPGMGTTEGADSVSFDDATGVPGALDDMVETVSDGADAVFDGVDDLVDSSGDNWTPSVVTFPGEYGDGSDGGVGDGPSAIDLLDEAADSIETPAEPFELQVPDYQREVVSFDIPMDTPMDTPMEETYTNSGDTYDDSFEESFQSSSPESGASDEYTESEYTIEE